MHAMEAGARGDAAGSLAAEMAGRVVYESPHRFIMQDLVDQGDAAPQWAYSRWCVALASRSMLIHADPRVDRALRLVLLALYPETMSQVADGRVDLRVLGTQVAAGDRLVGDIAAYEFGGLSHYLAQYAERGLLERTDRIRDWAEAKLGAYELIDFRGCRLVLRDLVDGKEVEALNIGAMTQASDETLVGRLAPISGEPGLMFTSRPMSVDAHTARAVADALRTAQSFAWLEALSDALHTGRQPQGFHDVPATFFTSDLPVPPIEVGDGAAEQQEVGGAAELRAKGYSAEVANALGVIEVGLLSAPMNDRAAAVVSPHISAALSTPGAFEAAQAECTGAETAPAWQMLAAVVPDHLEERCRALAACAEAAG